MSAETIENIADLLWNADFLLVVAGSGFQGNNKSPFLSGYCDSSLICNTRKFVGFWGTHYNDCLERNPHDGYKIISKWKHQYFSNCDDRKRKVGKSNNKEEENNPATPRLMVLTNSCDNAFQKCDLTDDEVYDIWGNITFFQCSRNPPCNNKIWKADNSSFRFLIDPATMEAPPIRYESDKKGNKSSIISCLRDLDADLHGGFLPFKEINVTESFESATKSKKMVVPQSHTTVKSVTTRSRSKISYSFSDRATCMYLHKDISPPIACKYMDLFDLPAANMTNKANATQELETDTNQDENSDIFSANEHLGISHFFHHFNVLWTKHNMYAGGNYRLFETEVFRNEWLNYCRSVNRHYDSSPTVSSRSRRTQVCFNVSIAVRDDAQEPGEMETFEIKHIHHKKFFPSDPFCWSQGSDGFFYFRGLSAEATYQEPINGGECDELVIPLKERSHHLPLKCTISVICETKQVPSGEVPMKQAFTSDHVWQMVGKCDLEKEDIFTLAQEQGIASAKNTRKNRAFELVLLSCSYYHVQLGIELQCGVEQPSGLAGSSVCLSYVRLFVPCKGAVDVLSPFEEQTIEISSLLDPKPEYAMFPPMNMSTIKEISLRPVPNYLVCKQCHDVARPFVLMTGNGKKKDEGVLQCVLNAKQKLFKTWENDIIQVLKNDPSRQVVILELGCDMKGDPCRALGEKFYKGVKSFKSTLIRIASHLFETKSKNADASNLITVEGEIIPVLTKIEKILQAKRRD